MKFKALAIALVLSVIPFQVNAQTSPNNCTIPEDSQIVDLGNSLYICKGIGKNRSRYALDVTKDAENFALLSVDPSFPGGLTYVSISETVEGQPNTLRFLLKERDFVRLLGSEHATDIQISLLRHYYPLLNEMLIVAEKAHL